jgi:hypothetical protein
MRPALDELQGAELAPYASRQASTPSNAMPFLGHHGAHDAASLPAGINKVLHVAAKPLYVMVHHDKNIAVGVMVEKRRSFTTALSIDSSVCLARVSARESEEPIRLRRRE